MTQFTTKPFDTNFITPQNYVNVVAHLKDCVAGCRKSDDPPNCTTNDQFWLHYPQSDGNKCALNYDSSVWVGFHRTCVRAFKFGKKWDDNVNTKVNVEFVGGVAREISWCAEAERNELVLNYPNDGGYNAYVDTTGREQATSSNRHFDIGAPVFLDDNVIFPNDIDCAYRTFTNTAQIDFPTSYEVQDARSNMNYSSDQKINLSYQNSTFTANQNCEGELRNCHENPCACQRPCRQRCRPRCPTCPSEHGVERGVERESDRAAERAAERAARAARTTRSTPGFTHAGQTPVPFTSSSNPVFTRHNTRNAHTTRTSRCTGCGH